jgi:glycosyltransferase involved in cell wall biosynthesis
LEGFAAFRQAARTQVTLTLVGAPSPDADRYLSNLPAGASWLGVKSGEELREIYIGHHVMVFPSLSEGCPLVVCEALAAGLPVLASPTAATVLTDNVDGFVIPPRDAASIVGALERLTNPKTLASMSATARDRALKRQMNPYGARVEAVYERLLGLGARSLNL